MFNILKLQIIVAETHRILTLQSQFAQTVKRWQIANLLMKERRVHAGCYRSERGCACREGLAVVHCTRWLGAGNYRHGLRW